MKGLTERQRLVLDFITTFAKEHGYPPTIREIGAGLGIRSTNGVSDHIEALGRKGFLERHNGARALRILKGDKP